MAKQTARTSTPPSVTPVETPAKPQETPAAVDWDALPSATVVTLHHVTASGRRKDLEETTPVFIKTRVLGAFDATVAEKRKNDKATPVTLIQQCGTVDAAEQFLKQATKYGAFKGWHVAGKVLEASEISYLISKQELPVGTKDGTVVSYRVREKGTRVSTPEATAARVAKANATRAANKAAKTAA